MAMVIKSPSPLGKYPYQTTLFLGGSISEGKSRNWQSELSKELLTAFGDDVVILNPRRSDWDSSWEQKKTFKPFREQVEWELKAQEIADLRVYFFDPDTKSPITLMELGLFAKSNNLVYCPEGYFRKGNVDIVCEKYDIPVHTDLGQFKSALISTIRSMSQKKR